MLVTAGSHYDFTKKSIILLLRPFRRAIYARCEFDQIQEHIYCPVGNECK
eukprot:Awhi_evm1s13226